MKNKLIRGLRNIHFAPKSADGQTPFEVPTPIEFAKKLENKFSYEGSQEWADDKIVDSSFFYNGGDGTLDVLGLTPDEQSLLFGNLKTLGGLAVTTDDVAPEGAFLFERQLKGGAKRLYVIYACTCAPADLNGATIEEGKAENEVYSITYKIGSYTHKDETPGSAEINYIYFYIDTNDAEADKDQVSNWFTEVQFPKFKEETPPETLAYVERSKDKTKK